MSVTKRSAVCSPSACLGAPAGWSAASTGRRRSQRRACSRPERATAAESAASRETPEREEHVFWNTMTEMCSRETGESADSVWPDTAWARSAASSPSSPGRRRPASSSDWPSRGPPAAPAARRCRPAGSDGCSGSRRSSDTCSCWRSSASPGQKRARWEINVLILLEGSDAACKTSQLSLLPQNSVNNWELCSVFLAAQRSCSWFCFSHIKSTFKPTARLQEQIWEMFLYSTTSSESLRVSSSNIWYVKRTFSPFYCNSNWNITLTMTNKKKAPVYRTVWCFLSKEQNLNFWKLPWWWFTVFKCFDLVSLRLKLKGFVDLSCAPDCKSSFLFGKIKWLNWKHFYFLVQFNLFYFHVLCILMFCSALWST